MTENIGLVRHEDVIQPFMLHNSVMRGRMVRLDNALNTILSRHAYHDIVSKQLGELMVVGAMLSANLPEGGILTLQAKGNGPVSFMVADIQQDGSIRGYANIEDGAEKRLDKMETENATLADTLGEGYLAMTLDMPSGEPYQGIVPLDGFSVPDAVEHYFIQSQQLDVMFNINVNKRIRDDKSERWVAAGIMLERMPELSHTDEASPRNVMSSNTSAETDEQSWDYNKLLVNTATPEELSDPHLAPSALLYRLFNEGGVWVYDTKPIQDRCRCSRGKIQSVLESMDSAELEEMAEGGAIAVNCQFCSTEERFTLKELTATTNNKT